MNIQDFCYWLQGYFELAMTPTKEGLSPEQVEVIKEHLQLVFKKETVKTVGDTTQSYGSLEDLFKHYTEKVKPAPMPFSPTPPHLDPTKWKSPYEITCSIGSRHIGAPKPTEPPSVTFKAGSYPPPPEPPSKRNLCEDVKLSDFKFWGKKE